MLGKSISSASRIGKFRKWWATQESNLACVSARELQSPATPCGLSPTEAGCLLLYGFGSSTTNSHAMRGRGIEFSALDKEGCDAMKKPRWVVEKERGKKREASETFWLFGLHAVRDALENPEREKRRLVVTQNALSRLGGCRDQGRNRARGADPRKFAAPLESGSVHQGAALEVKPLGVGNARRGSVSGGGSRACPCDLARPRVGPAQCRRDPALGRGLRGAGGGRRRNGTAARNRSPGQGGERSAGASALPAGDEPRACNGGAEGLRIYVLGLDGDADQELEGALTGLEDRPVALVMGAEGPGLRR